MAHTGSTNTVIPYSTVHAHRISFSQTGHGWIRSSGQYSTSKSDPTTRSVIKSQEAMRRRFLLRLGDVLDLFTIGGEKFDAEKYERGAK